jgi:23S rRNA (uracil1939-C5)-methyltransferase
MAFKKYTDFIEIIDIADKGKSVGKNKDGKIVFTTGCVPGDKVEVLILRKKKGVLEGIVKKIEEYSKFRTQAECLHFGICGGCKWQDLQYEKQLEFKDLQVKAALERIAKVNPENFMPILACEKIYYYRNKLEFSFSSKRWLTEEEIVSGEKLEQQEALGFHAPGNFEKIIPIENCLLQTSPSNEIRNFIRDFTVENDFKYWDAKDHIGLMRNIIIRTSSIGETMVTISFAEDEGIHKLLDALLKKFSNITSLNYVINSKFNDSIFDLDIHNYFGAKFIKERLGDVEFFISPKSFFQTNTEQSKKLYDIAIDFAQLKADDIVLDLYTGIGSIALYISGKVKKVTGIEIIPEAIEDAKMNAKLNNIENVNFIAGDVKKILTNDKFEMPDIIFVDPPRAGLDKDVVEQILTINPEKVVYISCNPATQARDIALMKDKYSALKSQAVDMFPHTHHVENVVLLKRIEV